MTASSISRPGENTGDGGKVGLQFAGDASSRWVLCTPNGKTFGCIIEVRLALLSMIYHLRELG